MPSDIAMLREWLKSIDDDTFVALPPPTTRNGPTDAAEVHERAFELIDARGLSRGTPYIGGHTQSEAFNSRGAMVGVLELQHSGHLEIIRQRLATIPDRFEVSGGASGRETFAIALRFVAEDIDLADETAVEEAVEAMNRGGFWPDGDPRLHGVALTPERLAWLHSVLAHGGHDLFLRERIIQLLDSHRALTDGELDVILADALAEPDHWYYSAPALTNALFERGRRDDAVALALAVAPSAGEEFRPHDCELLTFAPDMRTLERACELGALPEAEAIAAALGGAGA